MKKLFILMVSGVLVFATAGCATTAETSSGNPGGGSETTTNSDADAESTEESGGIEVDEGFLTVDITFPASFFSMGGDVEMTQETVDASVAEQGYLGGKLNDDGSVTYTMTKLKQQELLDQMKSDFDASIEGTLAEYPNVKSITRNNDFSEISIEVSEQDLATGFLALGFSFTAYFYQVLDGKEFKTDVVFVDAASGEELSRTTYPLED